MKKIFIISGIVLLFITVFVSGSLIYINSAYPVSSPPENIKISPTSEMLNRGEYLAKHVAYCIYCHSERDINKFACPLVEGTEGKGGEKFGDDGGYPGYIYVKNITPASIGGWSDGELIRAVTCGVTKDNFPIFPVMNYAGFNTLSKSDLYSIVAFIRTLKPIKNDVPFSKINFPTNIFIKMLPLKNSSPVEEIDTSNIIEYGKYLANIASCKYCHSPFSKGRTIKGKEFIGTRPFIVNGKTIYSPNITPDNRTGIGNLSAEKFIRLFKKYDAASIKNNSDCLNCIMPWVIFSGMTETDLKSIYSYLKTLPAIYAE
ncbi:MAG: cytochrome C [Bacteroidota bacterium]|nr:cytochrome C [Bacteroidota bacterium]